MGLKNTGRKCEPISFAAHRDERSEADKKDCSILELMII